MKLKIKLVSIILCSFWSVISCMGASQKPLSAADFHNLNGTSRLQSKAKFLSEKKGTIVFLGGSITHMKGWSEQVQQHLREQFPQADLTFLKAGIPSLGSVPHAFRFQQDVLDKGVPDLLFIEAAVNDRGNGYALVDQQRALEGIIRRVKQLNPKVDLVMMHFADPDKLKDYARHQIPTEIKNHNEVAAYYHIPVVNLAKEVYARIENKEFEWERDIKNLHPSPFGQKLYAQSIDGLIDTLLAGTTGPQSAIRPLPAPLHTDSYTTARYGDVKEATGTFTYVPCYDATGQPTREGFTHVPMLIGEKAGQQLSYTFTGNAIGLCIISGKDAGILEYSLDGGPYQTKDLFTKWSASLHLPWYVMLASGLTYEAHTLTIRLASTHHKKSVGHACRIVHFLVN
ncbi:MAG: SGNH/GDSL hydrolase family protein [Massilibacteroides sp.]|nr:SGNH/GDSL hydrolase family protein [Massilibacteroides sp.]